MRSLLCRRSSFALSLAIILCLSLAAQAVEEKEWETMPEFLELKRLGCTLDVPTLEEAARRMREEKAIHTAQKDILGRWPDFFRTDRWIEQQLNRPDLKGCTAVYGLSTLKRIADEIAAYPPFENIAEGFEAFIHTINELHINPLIRLLSNSKKAGLDVRKSSAIEHFVQGGLSGILPSYSSNEPFIKEHPPEPCTSQNLQGSWDFLIGHTIISKPDEDLFGTGGVYYYPNSKVFKIGPENRNSSIFYWMTIAANDNSNTENMLQISLHTTNLTEAWVPAQAPGTAPNKQWVEVGRDEAIPGAFYLEDDGENVDMLHKDRGDEKVTMKQCRVYDNGAFLAFKVADRDRTFEVWRRANLYKLPKLDSALKLFYYTLRSPYGTGPEWL